MLNAHLTGMLKYAFKQVPMDIQKFQCRKRERLLAQQFGYIGSHTVGLFLFCIVLVMRSFVDIIRFQLFTHLIQW